jgi:hypothetical protein
MKQWNYVTEEGYLGKFFNAVKNVNTIIAEEL